VSVCPSLAYITRKPHGRTLPIFLWTWLGSPAAALRYVIFFLFVDDIMSSVHVKTMRHVMCMPYRRQSTTSITVDILTKISSSCARSGEVCYLRLSYFTRMDGFTSENLCPFAMHVDDDMLADGLTFHPTNSVERFSLRQLGLL